MPPLPRHQILSNLLINLQNKKNSTAQDQAAADSEGLESLCSCAEVSAVTPIDFTKSKVLQIQDDADVSIFDYSCIFTFINPNLELNI